MLICAIAFLLFFVSDLPDLFGKGKFLKYFFFVGLVLLSWATVYFALHGSPVCSLPVRIVFMILSGCCLFLTIYSLFCSFLPQEGYGKTGEKRFVYNRKLYALSRHPGVLFLILCYAFLIPAFGIPVAFAALTAVLDLALAVFEDRLVFPTVLMGYPEYRKTTPFLIPTKESIRICLHDFRRVMK